jgi:hypothetical protein
MALFTSQPPLDVADACESAGEVVAGYATYGAAQQAVDRLADTGFPVEHTEIVGRDVRLVERVTGRMSDGRAAAAGAATGAWLGVLTGLLIGLFTFHPLWVGLIVGGLFIGTLWGGVVGLLAQRLGSGRHDLASPRSLAASRYELIVADQYAEEARGLLSPLA